MLIHIGSPKTLMTRCRKSVKRRWWVSNERIRFSSYGPLITYEVRNPRREANCPACLNPKKRRAA